jgi:hypothetical protein
MANSNLAGKSYKLPPSLQEKLNMESITYENLKRYKNRFETTDLTDEDYDKFGGDDMVSFVESQLGHIRGIDARKKKLGSELGVPGQGYFNRDKEQLMPANVRLAESIERIKKLMNI